MDGTCVVPGYKFVPLGVGVQGELTEKTSAYLNETALAAAKLKSDDVLVIDKLKKRIRMRFGQQLSLELMRAQADLILNHVVDQRRGLYSNALPRGRRAGHGRAHGPAAGRFRAGGGRGSASRAGHGR